MAGIKISALPAVGAALLTDFYPVVQGGVTSQETVSQLLTLFNANIQIASPSQITGLGTAASKAATNNAEPDVASVHSTFTIGNFIMAEDTAGTIVDSGISSLVPFPIAKGGTGVASVTIAPTASAFAGWDSHSNLSANNFLAGYSTTATAAGTTTLTVASHYQQFFTGSTTQTVVMPVASTLAVGTAWSFVNNSSGIVTIQSSGGNTIQAMAPGTSAYITNVLNSGTSAASWNSEYAFNGGAGSGTVNLGTGNDLAYYATTGTAVSGLTTGNNGVLVTSAGGVPSISSTLPIGIAGTNMALTTPTITGSITMTNGQSILDQNGNAVITIGSTTSAVNSVVTYNNSTGLNPTIGTVGADTNISLELYYKGTGAINILGTNTNSNAASGIVGEYVSSSVLIGSAVSVSNNTPKTITSISLTAGDWDVAGTIAMNPAGSTTSSYQIAGISTTTNTLPTIGAENNTQLNNANIGPGGTNVLGVGPMRISLAATTTVYLVAQVGFAVSTMTVYGFIGARRVR